MKESEDYSRRDLLKATSAGVSLSIISTAELSSLAEAKSNHNPTSGSNPDLFRFIDSGFEKSTTSVTLQTYPGELEITSYELETIGTNHPDVVDLSHEERFPKVAADIDSFGDLPPDEYKIIIERGTLQDQTTFTKGENGLPDGNKIYASLNPEGMRLDLMHLDD